MQNMVFTLAMNTVGFAESFTGTNFANLTGFALDTTSVFNLGLFHGFVFSLPFSAPILICVYRFLVEGVVAGSAATLGTILGQICFLSFILSNFRSLIQFWYTTEPLLALAGFALTFKLAADFFSGSGQRSFGISGSLSKANIGVQVLRPLGLNFLLMFLNPAMPATSSRIVLASPILTGLTEGFQLTTAYNVGFFITAALCISLLWPVVVFSLIQLVNRGSSFLRFAGTNLFSRGTERSSDLRGTTTVTPRFLTFLIVGCVVSGALQYSWRLFTQYPVEAVLSQPGLNFSAREFPSFDSNIRHRDKNLPVDRHTPIEKINARRTLSGRPPLSEEQKSDAYFKFNSFFVNGLEQQFENNLIASRARTSSESRLSGSVLRTYDEIEYLQKVKQQWEQTSGTLETQGLPGSYLSPTLQNNTKGKPKFSYIQPLIAQNSLGDSLNPLLHDELQIYGALLRPENSF
jgi:hypothetical protein